MAALKCKLLCHSLDHHVQQLYTGFKLLGDSGLIDVTQEVRGDQLRQINGAPHLWDAAKTHVRVELSRTHGRNLMLHFDTHDAMEIDPAVLADCDVYFKRSFSADYIARCHRGHEGRIHPLGLNYQVLPNDIDLLALRRHVSLATSITRKLGGALTSLDPGNTIKFLPRLRDLHALPDYVQPARVLFMVTAHDPHDQPDRPQAKIADRIHINETRADCVRRLRKELGPQFHGGFIHNRFTVQNYQDVLLESPADASKKNYLGILGQFPICIATTGLHGSIGGKFAEYVAFSKAIVSEKLEYQVPGEFGPRRNYLEFSTPEECVAQSVELLANHALRQQLMANNATYYKHYVRPDMLVLNALSTAVESLRTH